MSERLSKSPKWQYKQSESQDCQTRPTQPENLSRHPDSLENYTNRVHS